MPVFLSYRREDSAGYAGRICEHLSAVFGTDRVFMDVEDITPGQDFADAIEKTISGCSAVVVIIGPRWLSSLEARGGSEDFVRHEVSVALRRNVTVVPVLVGGGAVLPAAALPEDLKRLARLQALEIRDSRFEDDAKLLVAVLRKIPDLARPPAQEWAERRYWALALILVAFAALGLFWRRSQPATGRAAGDGTAYAISGVWIAEMSKAQQRPYRVRLELDNRAGGLLGTVTYPTGDATVQAGTLAGGHLSFFTVHTPQFGSEPATIRWNGVVEGDVLRLTAADTYGVAAGMARRVPH